MATSVASDNQPAVVVHFRSLEKPNEDVFSLELSMLNNYDQVVESVARQLNLDDPSKIRLTAHDCFWKQPKYLPIKYRGVESLKGMLYHLTMIADILYYEVVDIPLPELELLKTLTVHFCHATVNEVVVHRIRLPKQNTVEDLLNHLKTKVEMSDSNAELRLLEIIFHKIYKIYPVNEKLENISDHHWTLRAEEIPKEEKNLEPNDRLIHVYHFKKETETDENPIARSLEKFRFFGDPFLLVIHEGETLAEVKLRIQKKLQVRDEEFSEWKFASINFGVYEYLKDFNIVFTRFQRRVIDRGWEMYLGLEHSENASEIPCAANMIYWHTYEKSIRIYNVQKSSKSSTSD